MHLCIPQNSATAMSGLGRSQEYLLKSPTGNKNTWAILTVFLHIYAYFLPVHYARVE